MSLIKKLIPFLLVFSLIFYFVRMSDAYNTRILLADLGGVPWLYASVSTIFGILAAFAIQKEWDAWNALSEAVNGEVDSLEKLYLWSDHFPEKIKGPVQNNIKKYTSLVIRQWKSTERGEKTPEIDDALKALNDDIYHIFTEAPELMPTSFHFSRMSCNTGPTAYRTASDICRRSSRIRSNTRRSSLYFFPCSSA